MESGVYNTFKHTQYMYISITMMKKKTEQNVTKKSLNLTFKAKKRALISERSNSFFLLYFCVIYILFVVFASI